MGEEPTQLAIEQAAHAIFSAKRLLITAGAGMGVDSGLPDFRSPVGFWRTYPGLKAKSLSFQDIANPNAFRDNAELAWAFYGHRLELCQNHEPHAGYERLLRWGTAMPGRYFAFTSNVDGHFERAEFDPNRLIECHGTIHRLQCSQPCGYHTWTEDLEDLHVHSENLEVDGYLPRCPECGAIARPNILMFGDFTWLAERTEAQEARYRRWLDNTASLPLVIIECGAGSSVPTVRQESESIAERTGAPLIRINPHEPEGPPGTIPIPLPALEALERIEAELPARFRREVKRRVEVAEKEAAERPIVTIMPERIRYILVDRLPKDAG